jgi:2-dehydro-3-deoxyphosphogluconate aldolase/(4S)-4-hydroxy-2-oxoglutarate aldolase
MNDIFEQLYNYGLVPVIKITKTENAVPLAKALAEGGLNCAEITFRTACAKDAIKAVTDALPTMLVGAGTVLTPEQADEAIEAGAKFIVSPGLNPRVVKHCLEKGVPVLPGCATPSEVEQALELGLKAVKFFPAEAAGGLNMIKSMSAPYGGLKFMPTGGINEENMLQYLAFDKILNV